VLDSGGRDAELWILDSGGVSWDEGERVVPNSDFLGARSGRQFAAR
jgi:hypothetical protein